MSAKLPSHRSFNPLVFIVPGAALLIVAVAMLLVNAQQSDEIPPTPLPLAPDFRLSGLDGNITLSDYRGQYVLINFWATWCPPCIREMPTLHAYQQAHESDGFTLLAVNVGEDEATARAFIESNNFRFPVALDVNSSVFARYGGDSLPTSFLIGPDGKLVKAWEPGALTRAMLDRDVTPLLKG